MPCLGAVLQTYRRGVKTEAYPALRFPAAIANAGSANKGAAILAGLMCQDFSALNKLACVVDRRFLVKEQCVLLLSPQAVCTHWP